MSEINRQHPGKPNYLLRQISAGALAILAAFGAYELTESTIHHLHRPEPVEQYDPNSPDAKKFEPVREDDQHTTPLEIAQKYLKNHHLEDVDLRPFMDEISRQAGGAGNVQPGEVFHLPIKPNT